ncbi:hypothetical protein CKO38_02120 [Rhodospirillum rubrum]|uniref:hypothetical protein n=1 Tax=Rhodospirillum rubrum TaxID=1085 RepID=UPI0019070CE0|nr:hypothetical protein [Rhodospirillum rubrum]MBK1664035.1 hypothetical protein [Rhodospirillum rubrum]MBK1675489.1 hypothetical protein [Rhodospirillum rubrum]
MAGASIIFFLAILTLLAGIVVALYQLYKTDQAQKNNTHSALTKDHGGEAPNPQPGSTPLPQPGEMPPAPPGKPPLYPNQPGQPIG